MLFGNRSTSWYNRDIYAILQQANAALCLHDFEQLEVPAVQTADFIYIRFHGPTGDYNGKYSTSALAKWARFIRRKAKKGTDIYCYFNNDEAGYAPLNALQLSRMVAK